MSAPRRRIPRPAASRARSYLKDTDRESATAHSPRIIRGHSGHGSGWPIRLLPKRYYASVGASCTAKPTMMHPRRVISGLPNRSPLRGLVLLHLRCVMACHTTSPSRTSIPVSNPWLEPSAIPPTWWIRKPAGRREYGSGVSGCSGRSHGTWLWKPPTSGTGECGGPRRL